MYRVTHLELDSAHTEKDEQIWFGTSCMENDASNSRINPQEQ